MTSDYPSSNLPSDETLWARAIVLVREAGPGFAKMSLRSGIQAPIGTAVLAQGALSPAMPREAIVGSLRLASSLWKADDGSDAWLVDLNHFLAKVRDHIEAMGPAALMNTWGATATRLDRKAAKGSLDESQAALDSAIQQSDKRLKKLITLIRNEPAKAALSVRTRLQENAVQWQNTLAFLSHDSAVPSKEYAALMVLTGELIRQGALDTVFTESDLARIALFSTGTWLEGNHRSLTRLRLSAAERLWEVLNTPERGANVRQALRAVKTKASVPPIPSSTLEEQAEKAKTVVRPWLEEGLNTMRGESFGLPPMLALTLEKMGSPDGLDLLTPLDWAAMGPLIPAPTRADFQDRKQQVVQAIIERGTAHLLLQVDLEHMNQPDPKPTGPDGMRSFGF